MLFGGNIKVHITDLVDELAESYAILHVVLRLSHKRPDDLGLVIFGGKQALFSVNFNLDTSQEREECIVHKVNQLIARDSVRVILCSVLITGISPIPKPERSRYNRSVISLKLPFLFLIIKYF